jgi:hypothetical protein
MNDFNRNYQNLNMKFNLRAAILTGALLAIGITIYPPFNWSVAPRSTRDCSVNENTKFPRHSHEFIWASNRKPVENLFLCLLTVPTAGEINGTMDMERMKLYYALAALIAVVSGVLRKPKTQA